MKKSLVFLSAALLLASAAADAKSYKRGYSVNGMIEADYAALDPGSSWFYNWAATPPGDEGPTFVNYDLEFCPMIWNANYTIETLEATYQKYKDHIKYVLGYNEPNFTDQAHLTPAQAAADWPRFQEWALSHNLKIVSPAVNWSSWMQYNDPVKWLEEFFELLPDKGAHIDYVACHFYMPTGASVMQNIDRLKKFGKPIWLTEFCAASGDISNSPDTQNTYLLDILPLLEQDPMVYRYAWFMARTGNANWNGINLLNRFPNAGTLTDLGYAFTYLWEFPEDFYHKPGTRFAATDFSDQSGIMVKKSTDEDAEYSDYKIMVTDFGLGAKNEYVKYQVEFTESGNYTLKMRGAIRSATSMDIYWNGDLLSSTELTSTGGINSWGIVEIKDLNIVAPGKGVIQLVPSRSMNLESLEFVRTGDAGVDVVGSDGSADFRVDGNTITGADAVYSLSGTRLSGEGLEPGIYLVRCGSKTTKVSIQ